MRPAAAHAGRALAENTRRGLADFLRACDLPPKSEARPRETAGAPIWGPEAGKGACAGAGGGVSWTTMTVDGQGRKPVGKPTEQERYST